MACNDSAFDADDETLLEIVSERLCDFSWADVEDLPLLGSCARIVGDVLEADFLIGESGFQNLIWAENIHDLTSIVGSFEAIGAFDAAECIRSAFATIPEEVISSPPEVRCPSFPDFSTAHPLGYAGDLSVKYCNLSDDMRVRLVEYIRAHEAELSGLFSN